MKFIHRLGYYLGGFSIGLIILAFFLSGSKTTCDFAYFPEARVLKNIKNKPYALSAKAETTYTSLRMDSLDIQQVWNQGDVAFGESDTRKEPCGIFVIYGNTIAGKSIKMSVENCEENTLIQTIDIIN